MASTWTAMQDKIFETALAIYDRDSPDRWEKVASMVGGGKTAIDVKRHYDLLVEDVERIESGHIPFPNYRNTTSPSNSNARITRDAAVPVPVLRDHNHRNLVRLRLQ